MQKLRNVKNNIHIILTVPKKLFSAMIICYFSNCIYKLADSAHMPTV